MRVFLARAQGRSPRASAVSYCMGSAQGIICDGGGDERCRVNLSPLSVFLLILRGLIYRDRYHKLECLDVDFLFFYRRGNDVIL